MCTLYQLGDSGAFTCGRKILRLLLCSGKLVPFAFAFGFGRRRWGSGCVRGGAAEEEETVGNICIGGGVGEESEGGGFDGARGLRGSVSATEGDGEGVQFATMSGANIGGQAQVQVTARYSYQRDACTSKLKATTKEKPPVYVRKKKIAHH